MMSNREIAVVARDGRKTYARVFSAGGITSGETTCHNGDEFKPEIGAVIALCRAYEKHPEKVCGEVMASFKRDRDMATAKAWAKKHRESNRVERMKGTPAGLALKKGALHLTTPTEGMGVPGTQTKFRDKNGKVLYVGDLVTVQVLSGEVRYGRKWEDIPGLHFVVDEETEVPASKGQYIMGALSGCNESTGKIDGHLRVRLAKRWQEVEVGETHGTVTLTWEPDADAGTEG